MTDASEARDHADLLPRLAETPTTAAGRGAWWKLPLQLAGGFLAGMLGALLLIPLARQLPPFHAEGGGGYFVAGLVLSAWPHILLHEAGHAIAGKLAGMRLYAAGLGPWRLQQLDGRWRLQRARGVRGLGGFAAMAPSTDGESGRGMMLVFMLGGIAANALIAALCLAWIVLAPPGPLLHGLLGGTAVVGLFFAVLNLLPIESHGWQSDGKQALGMLRGDANALRQLALQRYSALMLAGVRPRDWPATLRPRFDEAEPEGAADRLHDVVYAQWTLDAGVEADPRLWPRLVGHHARLPDGLRQYVALVMAEHAGRLRDPALLAAWRAECEGGLIDLSLQRAWLDAWLAALQGRHDALSGLLDEAESLLPRASDPASRAVLADHLRALRERTAATPG